MVPGWDRVRPGSVGTSVIAAHVVSGGKADVFVNLADVDVGDKVQVYEDGDHRPPGDAADVIDKNKVTTDQAVWTEQPAVPPGDHHRDDAFGFRSDGHRKANSSSSPSASSDAVEAAVHVLLVGAAPSGSGALRVVVSGSSRDLSDRSRRGGVPVIVEVPGRSSARPGPFAVSTGRQVIACGERVMSRAPPLTPRVDSRPWVWLSASWRRSCSPGHR